MIALALVGGAAALVASPAVIFAVARLVSAYGTVSDRDQAPPDPGAYETLDTS